MIFDSKNTLFVGLYRLKFREPNFRSFQRDQLKGIEKVRMWKCVFQESNIIWILNQSNASFFCTLFCRCVQHSHWLAIIWSLISAVLANKLLPIFSEMKWISSSAFFDAFKSAATIIIAGIEGKHLQLYAAEGSYSKTIKWTHLIHSVYVEMDSISFCKNLLCALIFDAIQIKIHHRFNSQHAVQMQTSPNICVE